MITSSAATTSPSHALTVASSSRVPSGVPIDKIDPRATDPQRFGGLLRAAANAISSAVKAVKSAWNAFAKAVKKSFDAFKAWWKNHAWPAIERLATAWSLYEIWNELRNLIG